MNRPRVLLLNTDFERGGTPTVVRELATRLRARGHDIAAACLAPDGPVGREMRTAGVPVSALDARGALDFAVLSRLEDFIRSGRFDCVLSFLVHANVAAAWVSRRLPQVRWLQSIQTTQPRPRWHWLAQRWAARHAQRIVVPSQSIADCAVSRAGIVPQRIQIIPNGIDAGRFAALSPRPLGTPADVGFIGRLDPVKRIPDLLAAVGLLKGRVHLHVFGEGEERPVIERQVARQDLPVTLHGLVASPQEAMAQIGMLVLCSEAEGMPMVLLEAMAAGLPIVATDAPGIRDTVVHEETALLCPVGSAGSLAGAIERLLDDAVLRQRLQAAGRQRVLQHYQWETILPQYESLLFEATSSPRRA